MKQKLKNNTFIKSVFLVGLSVVGLVIAVFSFQHFKQSKKSEASIVDTNPILNVVGVPKGKTIDSSVNRDGKIFLNLNENCKINLTLGDFGVADSDCGGDGQANFRLSNIDTDNDGLVEYTIWVRVLNKPQPVSATSNCKKDPVNGQEWCLGYGRIQVKTDNENLISDVTKDLIYIYADTNADGIVERYNLFNDSLRGYFWEYDNNGFKSIYLRFYESNEN